MKKSKLLIVISLLALSISSMWYYQVLSKKYQTNLNWYKQDYKCDYFLGGINHLFRVHERWPTQKEAEFAFAEVYLDEKPIDPFSNQSYQIQIIHENGIDIGYRLLSAGIDGEFQFNHKFYDLKADSTFSLYQSIFGDKDIMVREIYYDTFFNDISSKPFSEVDLSDGFLLPYQYMGYKIEFQQQFDQIELDTIDSQVILKGIIAPQGHHIEVYFFGSYDLKEVKELLSRPEVSLYGFMHAYDPELNLVKFNIGALIEN